MSYEEEQFERYYSDEDNIIEEMEREKKQDENKGARRVRVNALVSPLRYFDLKEAIIERGYEQEITWSENLEKCDNPETFFYEYCWVVVNSGMKNQIAEKIWERILEAWSAGKKATDVFGHEGKAQAMEELRHNTQKYWKEYQQADDKLEYLKSLPWIGDITKYHLAKNLGHDVAKPDRHLERIADVNDTTVKKLCSELAKETGDRIATVDLVLWRSANLGLI